MKSGVVFTRLSMSAYGPLLDAFILIASGRVYFGLLRVTFLSARWVLSAVFYTCGFPFFTTFTPSWSVGCSGWMMGGLLSMLFDLFSNRIKGSKL